MLVERGVEPGLGKSFGERDLFPGGKRDQARSSGCCIGPGTGNEGSAAKRKGIGDLKNPVSFRDPQITAGEITPVVNHLLFGGLAKRERLLGRTEVCHPVVWLVNTVEKGAIGTDTTERDGHGLSCHRMSACW